MKAVLKSAAAVTALALWATAATAAGTDWETSGHDLGGQRYSPLTQINKSNVAGLQIAWSYHLTPAGYAGRPRLAEAIPIVVGNQHVYLVPLWRGHRAERHHRRGRVEIQAARQ